MMQLGEMLGAIGRDLRSEYLIPIGCRKIDTHTQDIQIRIFEKQTEDLGIGFTLAILWRRFELSLSWPNTFVPSGLVEKWHKRISENQLVFLWFFAKLKDMGSDFVCTVNGSAVEDINEIPSFEWHDFQLKWKSDFLEIQKGMDFDYQKMQKQISLFWGLILSFAGDSGLPQSLEAEGEKVRSVSTRYERSPVNRKVCLSLHGFRCSVCGLLMKEKYGDVGDGYIEVHHIIPVSSYGMSRTVDPSVDLIPVCPNCHAMIHRRNPPYTLDEVKEMLGVQEG